MSGGRKPIFPGRRVFPTVERVGELLNVRGGITIRELFMASALQGLCANPEITQHGPGDIARMARAISDEALAEAEGQK